MGAQRTTSTALVVVVLLSATVFIVAHAATTASGTKEAKGLELVVAVCKNLSNDPSIWRESFHDEPCESLLRSDNRSAVAKDYGDLVIVALDLLDRRIHEVAAKIDSMLRSSFPVHNTTELSFKYCAKDFASMVRTLPICREEFLKLKPLGKNVKDEDAMMAIGCMDMIGISNRECAFGLDTSWDYQKTTDFYNVLNYISLPWRLMQLATDYWDDDGKNW